MVWERNCQKWSRYRCQVSLPGEGAYLTCLPFFINFNTEENTMFWYYNCQYYRKRNANSNWDLLSLQEIDNDIMCLGKLLNVFKMISNKKKAYLQMKNFHKN